MNQYLPIALLAAPVIFHLVDYLFARYFSTLSPTDHLAVAKVAELVVSSVEQTYSGMVGAGKRQEAVKTIDQILSSFNMKADPALIDAAIESAVFAMKQSHPSETTTPK